MIMVIVFSAVVIMVMTMVDKSRCPDGHGDKRDESDDDDEI